MAKMIRVKQGPNGRVPLPAPIQGKAWIEGDEPVEVESTQFIRGRIRAGDLILVEDVEEVDDGIVTPEASGDVITTARKSAPKAKE